MRTIPIPQRQAVAQVGPGAVQQQALVSNVRMDANALNAPNRAMVGLGETIAGAGKALEKYELEKRDHINRGVMAKEEVVRKNTAAEISAYFEKNMDKPETWAEMSNSTWKQYEKEKATRAKSEKWAPAVLEADEMQYGAFRGDFGIKAREKQEKAEIVQANARIETAAETDFRAGNIDGYVAKMEQMNLAPDVKARRIRDGIEVGMRKTASNQLDAMRDMPPAYAIKAIEGYITNLKEKDATGRHADYETGKGGLSQGDREQLEMTARMRIREQERDMAITGRAAIAEIRMGRGEPQKLMALVESGKMTPEVAAELMPEVAQAISEWEAKQEEKAGVIERREDAVRRREAEKQQALAAKAQSVRALAIDRKKYGLRDIDQQVALGEITKEAGETIKEELIQASTTEMQMEVGPYEQISGKIAGGWWERNVTGRQPEDAEYQAIFKMIQATGVSRKVGGVELGLTKETRLKLMDELMMLKAADLVDSEEEGPGAMRERTFGKVEKRMRTDMIAEYKRLLPALGPENAGRLLLTQEADIRNFFDSAKGKPRSEGEVKEFREKLMATTRKTAGEMALEDIWK